VQPVEDRGIQPRPLRRGGRSSESTGERLIHGVLLAATAACSLVTVGIVLVLVVESLGFFRTVPLLDFFTDTRWSPLFENQHFGIIPLATGSLLVAVGAGIIALPVGLLTALYLSEYASASVRALCKPVLEVLAGIPTVVYGYFALTFVTPLLRTVFPGTDIFNAASAAVVVGIMIIPTVASISEDAFRAVPEGLRQGAFALGATRMEVSTRVVLPAALSGVAASFILGLSRALGETMAVTIAAGSLANLTLNPLESVQTMTAYIVQVALGDTPRGTLEYQTLFAVALSLFIVTLAMNGLSQWVMARFREEYR